MIKVMLDDDQSHLMGLKGDIIMKKLFDNAYLNQYCQIKETSSKHPNQLEKLQYEHDTNKFISSISPTDRTLKTKIRYFLSPYKDKSFVQSEYTQGLKHDPP